MTVTLNWVENESLSYNRTSKKRASTVISIGVIFPKTPRKMKVLALFQTFLEKIHKMRGVIIK